MKLFKLQRSPNWYARISVNGKDRWVSSGTTKKKEAQQAIADKIMMLKGEASTDTLFANLTRGIGQLPEGQRDHKRQLYASQLMGGTSSKLKLDDGWQSWLDSPMKKNPGQGTIEMYQAIWRKFIAWAKDQEFEYLHELGHTEARGYCAELRKSNFTGNTYNKHLRFLRSLFKVLDIEAGIVNNPWDGIPALELEKEGRKMFTPEQLKTICNTATGNLRYMIGIGLYTGLRLGDVVSLKWKEVSFDGELIKRVPSKTHRKGRVVTVPIHKVLLSLLKELREETKSKTYLFPEEYKRYQKGRSYVTKPIKKLFESCGIVTSEKSKDGNRKMAIVHYGYHSLRHSFISMCAANRVPRAAVMELVGHRTTAMNELYSHAGSEQKVQAIASLPALGFDNGSN